jgi:phage RecT family recombinase
MTAASASQKPATAQKNTPPPSSGKTFSQALTEFKGELAQRDDEYKASLPSHITPDKFQRVVVTAANLNPDILRADRRSLLNACSKAASDGLLPDGRDGALVIFKTKEKGLDGQERYVQKVTWMPMVSGIIKKARQSGEISALGARIVYQNEIDQNRFTHKVVDGAPKVDHEPLLWGDRGKPVLVYSFVQFKDGSTDFEFLHRDDVMKIRNVSRAKDSGPWRDWEEEMWKKSAIRRHAKRLPISSELFDAIARDDELTEFERQRQEAEATMLSAAKRQLGAPTVDAEFTEQTVGEESPLQRGLRLLLHCKSKEEADDLRDSIAEELAGEEHDQWTEACSAWQPSLELQAAE